MQFRWCRVSYLKWKSLWLNWVDMHSSAAMQLEARWLVIYFAEQRPNLDTLSPIVALMFPYSWWGQYPLPGSSASGSINGASIAEPEDREVQTLGLHNSTPAWNMLSALPQVALLNECHSPVFSCIPGLSGWSCAVSWPGWCVLQWEPWTSEHWAGCHCHGDLD